MMFCDFCEKLIDGAKMITSCSIRRVGRRLPILWLFLFDIIRFLFGSCLALRFAFWDFVDS